MIWGFFSLSGFAGCFFFFFLNLLLQCSCEVWRLCDLVPGKAEWTNQCKSMAYHARHALAVSWFKSIVLVIYIIPETKRTTQATYLALFLVGKRSCRLMPSYKVDVHKSRNQVQVVTRKCVLEAILDESCLMGERCRKEKGKIIYLLVPCCWKHSSPWTVWLQT